MNEQLLAAIREWTNNNKGNESVAGAANDLFYNSLSAQLQRDSDANYAETMMPRALEYQRGSQDIATAADLRRIASEGAILRDLTDQQGNIQERLKQYDSGDRRYEADTNLAGTRYSSDAQVKATQIGADTRRYEADTNLAGTRYSADSQASTRRYEADTNLEGTRYSSDAQVRATEIGARSQEEQRRIQGQEDRLGMTQATDEALRLRTDARGAIAAKGRRFFG